MKLSMKIPEERQRQSWVHLGGVFIVAMVLASVQAAAQPLVTPLAAVGESLIAPELAQAHPVIAQYHWSKLPNYAGKPKYGGTLHLDLRNEPTNWDPFTGNTGTLGWGSVVYNKLMQVDMTLTTAFETQGANLQQLFPICDFARPGR